MISPLTFLLLLILLTGLAWAGHEVSRLRRRWAVRGLAAQWEMRYVERDLFNLAQRIAGRFPVEGITDLRALDLIYTTQANRHRYVFTAEFTLGRIDRYRRQCRVAAVSDSSGTPVAGKGDCSLILAPEDLPIVEQYRYLHQHWDQKQGESM